MDRQDTPQVAVTTGPKSGLSATRLLGAIVLTSGLVIGLPPVLVKLNLMADLKPESWIILLATAFGLTLKLALYEYASGEFKYYKHGYDFSTITYGGVLMGLGAVQITARDQDLFPGFKALPWLRHLESISDRPGDHRIAQLFVLFLMTMIVTFITAVICKIVREQEREPSSGKTGALYPLGNMVLGAPLLGNFLYVPRGKRVGNGVHPSCGGRRTGHAPPRRNRQEGKRQSRIHAPATR